MNRTIKEATVKRFHYDDHGQLRRHLADFLDAYNFARRLKTSRASHPTNTSANAGQRSLNDRSEEHTSELQSLMRNSYAVFCLKKKSSTSNSNSNSRHDKSN